MRERDGQDPLPDLMEAARSLPTTRPRRPAAGCSTSWSPPSLATANGLFDAVRVPALVIHGVNDLIIRPKAGRATAAAIPGARLGTYPGMGHDLPEPLWPSILGEIQKLTRADASQTKG
ncbi:hypothetical protein E1293_21430 [Actinomadura darangshiensis]|uniref:Alpha/beta hydrolase n=1 Tax=Actinomadura darangshiensis TaxID=705336 RepID=A0A4R5B5P0_9ACTN|nr:hypothetical protein [Actinomadura darangshiensis]TDD80139.1 hypothetical protein E1293_21430 [Actinomadura darangshiensis]